MGVVVTKCRNSVVNRNTILEALRDWYGGITYEAIAGNSISESYEKIVDRIFLVYLFDTRRVTFKIIERKTD